MMIIDRHIYWGFCDQFQLYIIKPILVSGQTQRETRNFLQNKGQIRLSRWFWAKLMLLSPWNRWIHSSLKILSSKRNLVRSTSNSTSFCKVNKGPAGVQLDGKPITVIFSIEQLCDTCIKSKFNASNRFSLSVLDLSEEKTNKRKESYRTCKGYKRRYNDSEFA